MTKTVVINVKSKKIIRKSNHRNSVAKSSPLFSGKVLGIKIPGARGVLKNKTLQKVLVGAGAISVGLSLVQLINNPTLNKYAAKKEVRIAAAAVAGDIPGAAFQFFKEDGLSKVRGMTSGSSNQQIGNEDGFA